MSTHEERAAAEAAARKMLAGGPEARLLEIPGVYHVSVGAKERGGQLAHEMCIRVYVRTKQPLESIAPRDRIPREIEGVQTDVNVIQSAKPLMNLGRYRPDDTWYDKDDKPFKPFIHYNVGGNSKMYAPRYFVSGNRILKEWNIMAEYLLNGR